MSLGWSCQDTRTRARPHLLAGLGDGGGDPGAAEDDRDGFGFHRGDGGDVGRGGCAEMRGGRNVNAQRRQSLGHRRHRPGCGDLQEEGQKI